MTPDEEATELMLQMSDVMDNKPNEVVLGAMVNLFVCFLETTVPPERLDASFEGIMDKMRERLGILKQVRDATEH